MGIYTVGSGVECDGGTQHIIALLDVNKTDPVDGSLLRYNSATDSFDLNSSTTVLSIADGGNF